MSAPNIWAVYNTENGERVTIGTKRQVVEELDMPKLAESSFYDGRVINRRYQLIGAGRVGHPKAVSSKISVLPPWANGSRKWYDKVTEVRSVLLMTRNCALGDKEIGEDYIEPLKAMGVNAKVREKKGKEITGRGVVKYYDILEMV